MLQPKIYPELAGRALVLDADPFIVMVEDDSPWAEGLFFIVCIGVAVGVAQIIGSLLLTATLPPPNAMLEALLQGWRQLGITPTGDPAQFEESIRQTWGLATVSMGYGSGWARLFALVTTPFSLIVQWLVYGLIGHAVARGFGGTGSVNQTLGATALMAAPRVLLLLTAVPFVSVSGLLLTTWALLIVYRALEVAHDLSWPRAAVAAAAPLVLVGGALISFGLFFSVILTMGGGQ